MFFLPIHSGFGIHPASSLGIKRTEREAYNFFLPTHSGFGIHPASSSGIKRTEREAYNFSPIEYLV